MKIVSNKRSSAIRAVQRGSEDVGLVGGSKEDRRRQASTSTAVAEGVEEGLVGDVVRHEEEPRPSTAFGPAHDPLHVVAREGWVGDQHIKLGGSAGSSRGIEVLVAVVHVGEPQPGQMLHHAALAVVGVVDPQRRH